LSAIQIEQLTKNFGAVRALRGVDLSVRHGDVHGFIGPNGAGKSTTMRVLLGLLRKTSGTVHCSAEIPGGTPSTCTGGSRTSPAT
jgi:ABC-2 type transport system ATP-binding protein